HMPDAAERIFPGRPLTKSTILVNRSTIQSRTSPIQPSTLSKTSFHAAKYCLIFSHTPLAISLTLPNDSSVTFHHHNSTAPPTTSNAFLIPSHAGLIAFSHSHVSAAPTALSAPSTILRNVSDFL